MHRAPNVVARFWAKVRRTDGCWLWTGGTSTDGYGSFWAGRRSVRAHRFAYELEVGPIPEGLDLDHTCCQPDRCDGGRRCPHRRCVNPAHLEPVTNAENARRGHAGHHMRTRPRASHCPHNHEYTPENTRVRRTRSGTARACRTCEANYRAGRTGVQRQEHAA